MKQDPKDHPPPDRPPFADEEYDKLMARAPSPEQARRHRESAERLQRAHARRMAGVQRPEIDGGWGDDADAHDARRHRGVMHTPRKPRPRGAGRPRVRRRTSSSSRTSSADPGSDSDGGDGLWPVARPGLTVARSSSTRYAYGCLTSDERGEGT